MPPYRGVQEIFQKVRAWFFDSPELDLDPSSVRNQWISNVWRRTITYLWGVRNGVSVPVTIGEAGALRVETYGSGFTAYEVKTGTAADAYSATHELIPATLSHRWDFLIETNDADIKFYKPDGTTFYGDIPLQTGYYSISFTSPGVRIKNRVGGSNAAYHITAFC